MSRPTLQDDLSNQGEGHYKLIDDRKSGETTDLHGAYFQAGLFPSTLSDGWPTALEFAARAAYVHPGQVQGDDNTELTLAANGFFNGHRNKLTTDISWLTIDEGSTPRAASDWRFRIQWDISL
ncbi:MAG: hypothetical protein KJO70_03240 [Gammaproteobacteria bacterium]|nr:hypothetical protein [Gammaproteobacteria bacterium]